MSTLLSVFAFWFVGALEMKHFSPQKSSWPLVDSPALRRYEET